MPPNLSPMCSELESTRDSKSASKTDAMSALKSPTSLTSRSRNIRPPSQLQSSSGTTPDYCNRPLTNAIQKPVQPIQSQLPRHSASAARRTQAEKPLNISENLPHSSFLQKAASIAQTRISQAQGQVQQRQGSTKPEARSTGSIQPQSLKQINNHQTTAQSYLGLDLSPSKIQNAGETLVFNNANIESDLNFVETLTSNKIQVDCRRDKLPFNPSSTRSQLQDNTELSNLLKLPVQPSLMRVPTHVSRIVKATNLASQRTNVESVKCDEKIGPTESKCINDDRTEMMSFLNNWKSKSECNASNDNNKQQIEKENSIQISSQLQPVKSQIKKKCLLTPTVQTKSTVERRSVENLSEIFKNSKINIPDSVEDKCSEVKQISKDRQDKNIVNDNGSNFAEKPPLPARVSSQKTEDDEIENITVESAPTAASINAIKIDSPTSRIIAPAVSTSKRMSRLPARNSTADKSTTISVPSQTSTSANRTPSASSSSALRAPSRSIKIRNLRAPVAPTTVPSSLCTSTASSASLSVSGGALTASLSDASMSVQVANSISKISRPKSRLKQSEIPGRNVRSDENRRENTVPSSTSSNAMNAEITERRPILAVKGILASKAQKEGIRDPVKKKQTPQTRLAQHEAGPAMHKPQNSAGTNVGIVSPMLQNQQHHQQTHTFKESHGELELLNSESGEVRRDASADAKERTLANTSPLPPPIAAPTSMVTPRLTAKSLKSRSSTTCPQSSMTIMTSTPLSMTTVMAPASSSATVNRNCCIFSPPNGASSPKASIEYADEKITPNRHMPRVGVNATRRYRSLGREQMRRYDSYEDSSSSSMSSGVSGNLSEISTDDLTGSSSDYQAGYSPEMNATQARHRAAAANSTAARFSLGERFLYDAHDDAPPLLATRNAPTRRSENFAQLACAKLGGYDSKRRQNSSYNEPAVYSNFEYDEKTTVDEITIASADYDNLRGGHAENGASERLSVDIDNTCSFNNGGVVYRNPGVHISDRNRITAAAADSHLQQPQRFHTVHGALNLAEAAAVVANLPALPTVPQSSQRQILSPTPLPLQHHLGAMFSADGNILSCVALSQHRVANSASDASSSAASAASRSAASTVKDAASFRATKAAAAAAGAQQSPRAPQGSAALADEFSRIKMPAFGDQESAKQKQRQTIYQNQIQLKQQIRPQQQQQQQNLTYQQTQQYSSAYHTHSLDRHAHLKVFSLASSNRQAVAGGATSRTAAPPLIGAGESLISAPCSPYHRGAGLLPYSGIGMGNVVVEDPDGNVAHSRHSVSGSMSARVEPLSGSSFSSIYANGLHLHKLSASSGGEVTMAPAAYPRSHPTPSHHQPRPQQPLARCGSTRTANVVDQTYFNFRRNETPNSSAPVPNDSVLVSPAHSAFTIEERYAHDMRQLHAEMNAYRTTISTLTARHDGYNHLMVAFYTRLHTMVKQVEKLRKSSHLKKSDAEKLRNEIEQLRLLSCSAGFALPSTMARAAGGVPPLAEEHLLRRQPSLESLMAAQNQQKPQLDSREMNGARAGGSASASATPAKIAKASDSGGDKTRSAKKSSWIRSSFTRAFQKSSTTSKKSKTKGAMPTAMVEGASDADESSRRRLTFEPATDISQSTVFREEGKLSTEALLILKKQLEDKDLALTDVRLDALDKAREVDILRETVHRLKNENKILKHNFTMLEQRMRTESRTSSQQSLSICCATDASEATKGPIEASPTAATTTSATAAGAVSSGYASADYGSVLRACSASASARNTACNASLASAGGERSFSSTASSKRLSSGMTIRVSLCVDFSGKLDFSSGALPAARDAASQLNTASTLERNSLTLSASHNQFNGGGDGGAPPRGLAASSAACGSSCTIASTASSSSGCALSVASSGASATSLGADAPRRELTIGYLGVPSTSSTHMRDLTTWREVDQQLGLLLEDYFHRIDPGMSLGITNSFTTIIGYQLCGCGPNGDETFVRDCGRGCADADDLSDEGFNESNGVKFGSGRSRAPIQSPAEFLVSTSSIRLRLSGAAQNSLDALVLESLLPRALLRQLLDALLESRRVLVYGGTGVGKSNLARYLARYLSLRLRADSRHILELHFPDDDRDPARVQQIQEQLVGILKGTLPTIAVPTILIIDNIQRKRIDALGDAFALADGARRATVAYTAVAETPYVICTLNRTSESPAQRLQLQHNFRLFSLNSKMDAVKGYMGRYLRRRIAEEELGGVRHSQHNALGPGLGSVCPMIGFGFQHRRYEFDAVVEFLGRVLDAVNEFIENANASDVTLGPRIFLQCPLHMDASREWFVELWNEKIVPYMCKVARDSKSFLGMRGLLKDPTLALCEYWPWIETENGARGEMLLKRVDLSLDGAITTSAPNANERNDDAMTSRDFDAIQALERIEENRGA